MTKKQAPLWHVMTRTRGGVVSLLKNLTKDEARGVMQRLRRPLDEGDPWSDFATIRRAKRAVESERLSDGTAFGFSNGWHTCNDGDLEQIECWGPPGQALEVWPKPADYAARYSAALEAARAALAAEPEAVG